MLVQTSILQQITTKNLLTVTITQTKLEDNFEIILKALKSHESSMANLNNRMTSVQAAVKSGEQKRASDEQKQALLREQLKKIESQLSEMKDQMNNFEQFKKDISQKIMQNTINPESRNEKDDRFYELKQQMQLLQEKVERVQEKVNLHDAYDKRITDLQKELKEQNAKINKLDDSVKEIEKQNLKIKSAIDNQLSQQNVKKMLSELEASIDSKTNDKIKTHQKEVQSEVQKLNDKINQLKNQMGKINDTLNDHNKAVKKCSEDIWKLNEQIYKLEMQKKSNLTDNMDSKRIIDLEKRVKRLQESINTSKIQSPNKTESSPVKRDNLQKQQLNLSQIKQEPNFKQEIIDKLKQQKGDFAKALKKLDTITIKKDEDKFKIGNLQDKILRIQHLLDTKVDDEGMKKWMRYIQNKIAYLYRMVNVDVPEEDACIVRKNWICLSCDKNLDSYKGKLGNHLVSAQLKGKAIQNEIIGGGMLFRSKSRYQIPCLKK